MKFLDVDATSLVAETRSLPSYLHGLHGTRLHLRLWRILLLRDSRFYACTPTRLVDHKSRIHQYKGVWAVMEQKTGLRVHAKDLLTMFPQFSI